MDEENFYQDEFGQQSHDFYERMPSDESTDGEAMADDNASANEDVMPADDTAATTGDNYQDAFRETLDETDQVGDETLINEAEGDFTSEKLAETDEEA